MKEKKPSKHFILFGLIVVGIFSSVLLYIIGEVSLIDSFTLFTAIIGFYKIYDEFHATKNLNEANFITNLNQQFCNNERINCLYSKINNIENQKLLNYFFAKKEDKEKLNLIEIEDLENSVSFLSFFETIYLLYERDILEIETINDLFAARFFKITNNSMIQDLKLVKDRQLHQNIYRLHKQWLDYRIKNKHEPILHKTSLSDFYRLEDEKYFYEPITFDNKHQFIKLQNKVLEALKDKTIYNPLPEDDLNKMIEDLKNKCYFITTIENGEKKYVASAILSTGKYAKESLVEKFTDNYYMDEIFYFRTVMVDPDYRGQQMQNILVEKLVNDAIYLKGKVLILAINEKNIYSINNFLKQKFVFGEEDIYLGKLKRKYMYKTL